MDFRNSYYQLGNQFFEELHPQSVANPRCVLWNQPLARELQISEDGAFSEDDKANYFSGNRILPGAKPIALAYAGHQFGQFNPQLGDGRAHLLGDVVNHKGGLSDIQLKGSGRTPFSRGGDGRCALGPALREYIMSEAMHALNVPTTRTLAVVITGEMVFREQPVPGAVVTRVAASHLRVGTFEYFAAKGDYEAVAKLCSFAVERHFPDLKDLDPEARYIAFLNRVVDKQIELVCHWMRVGFIHGVMNTDNTAISGETIDYGPCAMMGVYNPKTVFSSIDSMGRYRYGQQPNIAQWNLARLAETLIPLIHENEQEAVKLLAPVINGFSEKFKNAYMNMLAQKIGLQGYCEDDESLLADLLDTLKNNGLDYTITFDLLTKSFASVAIASELKTELAGWFDKWQQRLGQLSSEEKLAVSGRMRRVNPVVIPRNHHVEAVLDECIESADMSAAERLLTVLRSPYQEVSDTSKYQDAPQDGDRYYQTFCGT